MKYHQIPGSDLTCSVLSLGGQNFGSTISKKDSYELMDAYIESGGNIIDTAFVYANWRDVEDNISEKTIGAWMKERNNRDQLIVTTKGAHPHFGTMNQQRLAYEEITEDVDTSLKNLQVDTIDLYWLHRDDPTRPVSDILTSLNTLAIEGKIRYYGCSNWTTERLIEAQRYAEDNDIQGFVASQIMWSLAKADLSKASDPTLVVMDEKMKEYHLSSRLALFAYSSQAQGLFTKWETGAYSYYDKRISTTYRLSENIERFKRAKHLASELNVSVNQISLSYLLLQQFPSFAILGSRTKQQLEESCQSVSLELTDDQLRYLESI